jgi:6-phosphofructokinase
MLFTIGGDGTLRGAGAIVQEIERRGLPISLIGIPKTIDNDLMWIERSFGFYSAVEEARRAVQAAQTEASSVQRGVGLVKLMGRHSGFIAAHAGLADNDVDFCLIPEARFRLDGDTGLFRAIEEVLKRDGNALIVVAEGAGQELLPPSLGTDSSGNKLLQDIGAWSRNLGAAEEHLSKRGVDRQRVGLALDHLAEASLHVEIARRHHHARVRRVPQDRQVLGVPGEDALGVSEQQPLRLEVATERKEAVLGQVDRRKHETIVEPEDRHWSSVADTVGP